MFLISVAPVLTQGLLTCYAEMLFLQLYFTLHPLPVKTSSLE